MLSKLSRHVAEINRDGRTLRMLLNIKDHALLPMGGFERACLSSSIDKKLLISHKHGKCGVDTSTIRGISLNGESKAGWALKGLGIWVGTVVVRV